jgi:plasmid maintenance system killer protein
MEITFVSSILQKVCENSKECTKKHGAIRAKILRKRLDDLCAIANLHDAMLAAGKVHPLRENRSGQFAVHLDEPYRLVFIPTNDPLPILPNGNVDIKKITNIKIIEIIDYHD